MTTMKKDPSDTADREIVISRDYDAPRELVWEAMTRPEHLSKWWGPRGFTDTIETHEFRVGGTWKHIMHGPDGKDYPNKSIFKEIVPGEKIVFGHGGGNQEKGGAHFTATWSLESLGPNKTRLTARMVFPDKAARDFVVKEYGAIEGGKQTLERLSEQLVKMQTTPFVITRTFDAPRDLVWKAWTERESLKTWFGPKGSTITKAELDFRPGGHFHYGMQHPNGMEMWGKFMYREIVPPRKIVLVQVFSDANGGVVPCPFLKHWPMEMLATTTLTEDGGKTTITIEWTPLHATAEERQTFESMRASMQQGWSGTFEQLAEYLAKNK